MTRFMQGTCGNKNGRPKGSISLTSAIRRKLTKVNPDTKRKYLDDMVDVMIDKAVNEKDFKVIREIWNHIDGTPKQAIEKVEDIDISKQVMSHENIMRKVDEILAI